MSSVTTSSAEPTWASTNVTLNHTSPPLRLHYLSCTPPTKQAKGTVLLIHGFPQTSHQFRHVLRPLAQAGYRAIAPDYRGAGGSSHPASDFRKSTMAEDLRVLVTDHLRITEKIHVIGHDIGGMIAHAFASRYPDRVASVTFGECPLPGTAAYADDKTNPRQFHFVFHSVLDLPEALVAGRERIYLRHFFDKLAVNGAAIGKDDLDEYVVAYEQPGAMRCAFGVYRAFEADDCENRAWVAENGKCRVPALGLNGNRHAARAEEMVGEVYESFEVAVVEECGHYLAEEKPHDFTQKALEFIRRHS